MWQQEALIISCLYNNDKRDRGVSNVNKICSVNCEIALFSGDKQINWIQLKKNFLQITRNIQ